MGYVPGFVPFDNKVVDVEYLILEAIGGRRPDGSQINDVPGLLIATTLGTVSAVKSVTFYVASSDATILGVSVDNGETFTFAPSAGRLLDDIAYNPGTGKITIITIS